MTTPITPGVINDLGRMALRATALSWPSEAHHD